MYFEAALNEFKDLGYVSYDRFNHTNVQDLVYTVQNEIDLFNEGEPCCLIESLSEYRRGIAFIRKYWKEYQ